MEFEKKNHSSLLDLMLHTCYIDFITLFNDTLNLLNCPITFYLRHIVSDRKTRMVVTLEDKCASLWDKRHTVCLTIICQCWVRFSCHEPGLRISITCVRFNLWGDAAHVLGERTWLQSGSAQPSLSGPGLLGPLRWQRHSSWGPGFLQRLLAACLPLALRTRWTLIPSSDTVSQGGVSRYTSLPPTIIVPL